MEKEEFELMYNFIYKNYKKNEIKQAINSVCNYIASKQIKKYNKKMLAELLTKMAELTPYNGIVWSVRANKKNNKKIKNIMETKELKTNEKELIEELVEALIWCSGSNDFQEDGIAREGWLKVKELIDEALEYLKQ